MLVIRYPPGRLNLQLFNSVTFLPGFVSFDEAYQVLISYLILIYCNRRRIQKGAIVIPSISFDGFSGASPAGKPRSERI